LVGASAHAVLEGRAGIVAGSTRKATALGFTRSPLELVGVEGESRFHGGLDVARALKSV